MLLASSSSQWLTVSSFSCVSPHNTEGSNGSMIEWWIVNMTDTRWNVKCRLKKWWFNGSPNTQCHALTSTTSKSCRIHKQLWTAFILTAEVTSTLDWPSVTPNWWSTHWKKRNSVFFLTALFACLHHTVNNITMKGAILILTCCALGTAYISVANHRWSPNRCDVILYTRSLIPHHLDWWW